MKMAHSPPNSLIRAAQPADADPPLRQAAARLEATFLAEMLKHSGLHASGDEARGGMGEAQFSSFLVDAHAHALTKAGGIGLAQQLYDAMKARQGDV